MVSPVLMASFVTVVPAMGTLWWFLDRYEGLFEDARLFFALIVGFFAGLGAAAFEFYTDFAGASSTAAIGAGTAFIFFVAGYAFFETGIKTMALGLKRFKGRKDTPYYGMALGLGLGAMLALMIVANALRVAEESGNPYQPATFAVMTLIPIGAILAHGATGVWVGVGSSEGKLWKGWGIGTLLQMPMLGVLWLWWPSIGQGNVVVWFPSIVAIVYGAGLIVITEKRVLQAIVPRDIAKQVRRDIRRQRRLEAAGAATGAAVAVADDSEE